MKFTRTLGGVLAVLALSGATCFAAPLQWAGNGHSYELVVATLTWEDAKAAAEGMGGYLATLTSVEENQWVYENIVAPVFLPNSPDIEQAWLGGYTADNSGSTTDPNNWKWVTGEPWSYTNWGTGEPNGDSSGLTINRFADWTWNDESGWQDRVRGYVVEYSGVADGGTTAALLGLGLLGLATVRRRA